MTRDDLAQQYAAAYLASSTSTPAELAADAYAFADAMEAQSMSRQELRMWISLDGGLAANSVTLPCAINVSSGHAFAYLTQEQAAGIATQLMAWRTVVAAAPERVS